MKKYKESLLKGLLVGVFAFIPTIAFTQNVAQYALEKPYQELKIERVQGRLRHGVYYGRSYWYSPHHFNEPFRPYYYPYYYYPHRPHHYYRW